MIGANTIVRKIHESIPGITIEEDDHFIKMIAQVHVVLIAQYVEQCLRWDALAFEVLGVAAAVSGGPSGLCTSTSPCAGC